MPMTQNAGAGLWPVLKVQSGAYLACSGAITPGGGGYSSANYSGKICFVPVVVAKTMSISGIAMSCFTASTGKTGRLGIYSNLDGKPSALLLDAGTFSLTGTGFKEVVTSYTLTPGVYWLAFLTDATGGEMDGAFGSAQPLWLGAIPDTYSAPKGGYSGTQAYGALPSAPPALTATVPAPLIFLKAA